MSRGRPHGHRDRDRGESEDGEVLGRELAHRSRQAFTKGGPCSAPLDPPPAQTGVSSPPSPRSSRSPPSLKRRFAYRRGFVPLDAADGRLRRRLGDLGRGRPLGGQHQPGGVEDRRARRGRLLRRRRRRTDRPAATAPSPPRCTSATASGASTSPARARAPTPARATASGSPAGLRRLRRQQGPGADAPGARDDQQEHQGRRRPDRRQRLRLRRHPRDVRDQLDHVAVVVEELLPRRLEHEVDVLRRRTSTRSRNNVRGVVQPRQARR